MKKDLLSLWDLGADEIRSLMRRAGELKHMRAMRQMHEPLAGMTLGMIFEKASTRTRVSFEVGMYELGGHAVYLATQGSQIGRGEPLRDTARVLAGYCHGIVIRTFGHDVAEELARFAPVPVINGLTDLSHPCQVLADLFTVWERLGPGALDPGGARFAWIGDGNNMAHSWIEAAAILGLDLSLACPEGYDPDAAVLGRARKNADWRAHIDVVRNPAEATRGRAVISTDVWASMGEEGEQAARVRAFDGFTVDDKLLQIAAPEVMVLHCLPAHRGEEITESVLEGPHSAVFQQAENRLHIQKAILERLLAPR
ncbi:MAG: ornithine carbamoyltransferase [Myxococcales bacterium]|nr:ornithine carbamoyltransferase [Myxococcales bacterium]